MNESPPSSSNRTKTDHERQLPHLLRRAVEALEPELRRRGYSRAHERYDPDSFGSAYVHYESPAAELRLIYDGKDSAFRADRRQAASAWSVVLELEARGEAALGVVDTFIVGVRAFLEGHPTTS